jgi:GDP-4-dehydro-6-deoxy-D-mannose reductase
VILMAIWVTTGGSGFIGGAVLSEIASRLAPGDRSIALGGREPSDRPFDRFERVDLENASELAAIVGSIAPTHVIHAAGKTRPADPSKLYRSNTLTTLNLLDACKDLDHRVRFVVAGSAAELGPVPVADLPVADDYPARPVDPYGLSKHLATVATLLAEAPIEPVAARLFNPIGPGLSIHHVFGKFAHLLLESKSDPAAIDARDLAVRRDFFDVRDAAAALVELALNGSSGRVYHVGSGSSRSIGEGLDLLIALSGRKIVLERDDVAGSSRDDPSPRRTVSNPIDSRANIARIVADTAWRPRIAFEKSIQDIWKNLVAS